MQVCKYLRAITLEVADWNSKGRSVLTRPAPFHQRAVRRGYRCQPARMAFDVEKGRAGRTKLMAGWRTLRGNELGLVAIAAERHGVREVARRLHVSWPKVHEQRGAR